MNKAICSDLGRADGFAVGDFSGSSSLRNILFSCQIQASGRNGPTLLGSLQKWIERISRDTAAAKCMGPLSTLITKAALRSSQISCARSVRLTSEAALRANEIGRSAFPTIITGMGAIAAVNW